MMSFISVPLVVGIICAGIYGLFELFVRKKERLAIIWMPPFFAGSWDCPAIWVLVSRLAR